MSAARRRNQQAHAVVEGHATRKSGNRQSSDSRLANDQAATEAKHGIPTGQPTDTYTAPTTRLSTKEAKQNATIRSSPTQSRFAELRSRSSADITPKRNTPHVLRDSKQQACYPEDTTSQSTGRMHASRSPLEAAPAAILRQPRGPTQSHSGLSSRHQPSSLSPLARPFVIRAGTAPSDGRAAMPSFKPTPQPMNPPSASLRTPLPTQPTTHAANGASSAPSLRAVAPAASIETTIDEHAPNIAGPHPPASSSTLQAQTPAAVDLPAWPLPLPTDPFHHGAYIAMLSLAEKLGAPVNHQLLALALVPTLALYSGSVLRSDGVSPAPTSAAPSTTVPTTATPSSASIAQVTTMSSTADCPAPSAATATVPSPAVSVPSPASYVPPYADSVPPPASSAPRAATNSTHVSGQRVQRTLNGSAITTSATDSTAVPMSTSISQGNSIPITPTGNDSTDAVSTNIGDTFAPPQARKRNRGGKRVWLRIEKAKVRDALRAAEARVRRVEQSKADVTGG